MRTSSFEHIVRLQFNSLMLIIIKNKLKSRYRQLERRSKREVLFCCFLQALFPQKCRLTSSKLHGEFPQYCISPSGTLLGAGEEPLQAYKVY